MISPSYIVMMRSDRRNTSSRSAEHSRIAQPALRFSMMREWMNSIAPTSTPRVGWAITSTGVSNENSRAMTTFCMLPPDIEPTVVSTPAPRISNFS